jgi:ADP-ribosylation factor-like protein 2
VLGLDNAGKTTIVRRLCDKPIDSIEPTLGFSIQTLEYDLRDNNNEDDTALSSSSSTYQLHLWDIGGQSTIRAYWRNYFEKTDGIIWVVDSGDRRRLALVKEELDAVLQQERLEGATLLVLANKSDLEGSMGPEAVAAALELHRNQNQTANGETGNNVDIDNNNDVDDGNGDKHHKPDHSSRHWTIQASSAVTGSGLAESIDWLIRDITDRIYFAA